MVKTHTLNGDAKKKYYSTIRINGTLIEGHITNKATAIELIFDVYHATSGQIFENSLVGDMFIVACAYMIYFNQYNANRSLDSYVYLPDLKINKYLLDSQTKTDEIAAELLKSFLECLQGTEGKMTDVNNSGHFDKYLRTLEFESAHNVSSAQIKKQYRKLAKKYHPDSQTGDANQFMLINEAYEYLQANYID